MQQALKFKDFLSPRPVPSGIDVICKLQHFAIITYAVPPERFHGLIDDRFELDTIELNGREHGLISVVPFIDVDFTSAVYPFPKFRIGQTNYRIYVRDTDTGKKCLWFLGTTLDSWTIFIPRFVWNLPWYPGSIRFDCKLDPGTDLYKTYSMKTRSQWAAAEIELHQKPEMALELKGFPDLETGLVFLTHPLTGFYYRRDGRLGTYRVWHKQLKVKPALLDKADFQLLTRLEITSLEEQQNPHSVLIEPISKFTIYLPPTVHLK